MSAKELKFPKDFLWGAATSSHQVEGRNVNNDWWEWEKMGKLKEPAGLACDHWNRFREDFEISKSLSHNAHRFSVEWSRIEPAEGQFSQEALFHYREVISALRSNGLEPIVTLYHFTLPLWFIRKGGWLSPEAPRLFARYVQKTVEAIGQDVRYWITLNEPLVYAYKGYLAGEWPPGERSYPKGLKVLERLLHAHVLAYEAIKRLSRNSGGGPAQVGIAKDVILFAPCSPDSWKDRLSAWLRDLMFNRLFVKALVHGQVYYPALFWIRLPRARTLDFLGLNYYARDFVHYRGLGIPAVFGDVCSLAHHREGLKRNCLSWEIYPKGLYCLVKGFSSYRLPILISENGVCTSDDTQRWEFIRSHLRELWQAIQEGVPVIGYLYWSLLDNYEWTEGFEPRFGLVEVDYATQERRIRDSARQFAEVCRTGILNST